MNKELKFSWAHILALLAAMFFGYMSFVGSAYRSQGDMTVSVTCAVIMVVGTLALTLIPQIFKASATGMAKKIWAERILLFTAPVLCLLLAGATGGFNYLNIVSNKSEIESKFEEAKVSASEMFAEYDSYSRSRVNELELALRTGGITDGENYPSAVQIDNMILLLANKITFDNRELAAFRHNVDEYLGGTETTINNVSVLADIQSLQANVQAWHAFLVHTSEAHLSFENTSENFSSRRMIQTCVDLSALQTIINDSSLNAGSSSIGIFLLIVLGLACMYLPWIAQDRHSKSVQGLFGGDSMLRKHYAEDPHYPAFTLD